MPVQRLSKGFKDLSASFQTSPLSNDLIALKNESAIARSVRNLVLTIQGERPFQPVLGTGVSRLLFENMDKLSATAAFLDLGTYPILRAKDTTFSLKVALSMKTSLVTMLALYDEIYVLYARVSMIADRLDPSKS